MDILVFPMKTQRQSMDFDLFEGGKKNDGSPRKIGKYRSLWPSAKELDQASLEKLNRGHPFSVEI